MTNPLEELTELSNEFEIGYQRFRDAKIITWSVTLKTQPHNLKGRGNTLEEAVQDLHRQAELTEFEKKLQHAKIGTSTVEEMKANIRRIL